MSGTRTRILLVAVLAVLIALGTTILLWVVSGSSSDSVSVNTTSEGESVVFDNTINTALAFIALDDNGASGELVGCGDSVVLVDYGVEPGPAQTRLTRALLAALDEDATYGASGLHNPLGAHSDLSLNLVTEEDGLASIYFVGTLEAAHCEVPRFEAQVEQLALQFDGIDRVEIFVNETSFEELTDSSGL